MGVDITSVIGYHTKDNGWDVLPVYVHERNGSIHPVETYPGRHTEFFAWLTGERDGGIYGDIGQRINRGIPNIAPNDVPSYVMHEHMAVEDETFGASYLTLGEIRELIKQMPKKVKEWDEVTGKTYKERNEVRDSLKAWYHNIYSAYDMSLVYVGNPMTDIRVYFWFDC